MSEEPTPNPLPAGGGSWPSVERNRSLLGIFLPHSLQGGLVFSLNGNDEVAFGQRRACSTASAMGGRLFASAFRRSMTISMVCLMRLSSFKSSVSFTT